MLTVREIGKGDSRTVIIHSTEGLQTSSRQTFDGVELFIFEPTKVSKETKSREEK